MCSIEGCVRENFQNSGKCILHCEKDNWFKIYNNGLIVWNIEYVRKFWKRIQSNLDDIYTDDFSSVTTIYYDKVIFPKFEKEYKYYYEVGNDYDMGTNFYSYGEFRFVNRAPEQGINSVINNMNIVFDNCTFLDKINLMKYKFKKKVNFKKCRFYGSLLFSKNLHWLKLKDCDFKDNSLFFSKANADSDFQIINCKNIKNLNFHDSTFEGKFRLQKTNVNNFMSLKNTKFLDLADFYKSSFLKKVNIQKTDFEDISVFSEVEFNCDVDFKYTKFLEKAIFRDTLITGRLNLRDTIFHKEANFLNITSSKREKTITAKKFISDIDVVNVSNRETARMIKNFFDIQNNVIEANKYYELEMNERLKEFKNLKWSDYSFLESGVFLFHRLSSNHSQSWFLSFFWIISFTFIYSLVSIKNLKEDVGYYSKEKYELYSEIINKEYFYVFYEQGLYLNEIMILFLSFASLIFTVTVYNYFFERYYLHTFLLLSLCLFWLIYVSYTNDYTLLYFGNTLNPFSIMIGNETLTFMTLLYKVVMAYLIYQLIVSIRQNTRRK